jgi:hypothetical protein
MLHGCQPARCFQIACSSSQADAVGETKSRSRHMCEVRSWGAIHTGLGTKGHLGARHQRVHVCVCVCHGRHRGQAAGSVRQLGRSLQPPPRPCPVRLPYTRQDAPATTAAPTPAQVPSSMPTYHRQTARGIQREQSHHQRFRPANVRAGYSPCASESPRRPL